MEVAPRYTLLTLFSLFTLLLLFTLFILFNILGNGFLNNVKKTALFLFDGFLKSHGGNLISMAKDSISFSFPVLNQFARVT